jgi:hypothetical protein
MAGRTSLAKGSIRKRGDCYYIRTRIQVIDPATGERRWKQVEMKAATSRSRQWPNTNSSSRIAPNHAMPMDGALISVWFARRAVSPTQLGSN